LLPLPDQRWCFLCRLGGEVPSIVDGKLEHLLSRLVTLERRLEEVLEHLIDLTDAINAIELKLRQ
jgi:hypothetical protein